MNPAPVETLRDIEARCDEVGDCLEWRGAMCNGKTPTTRFGGITMPVRRLAMMLHLGGPVPEGHVVLTTCGNPRCVAVEHLVAVPKGRAMRRISKMISPATKKAAGVKANRQNRKLDDAQVAEIRATTGPLGEYAQRFGVSTSLVSKIRLGARYSTGNVWAGLMR